MSNEMKKRNMIFSSILKTKIQDRLIKKEQVILLLNRRGFSTVISCKASAVILPSNWYNS